MTEKTWLLWAVLSAFFAALTGLLAKIGVDGVPSNLATAIRTTVVLVLSWGIAAATSEIGALPGVGRRALLALGLSGLATGLSWLCYFRALQLGSLAKVAPVDKLSLPLVVLFAAFFLGERLGPREVAGVGLVLTGIVVLVWK